MAELDEAQIRVRIKRARREAGLSQTTMADLLGVIPRTIQNYENDHVPWGRIRDIAEVTGKPTRWLLHGDESAASEHSTDLAAALAALDTKLSAVLEQLGALGAPEPALSPSPGDASARPDEVVADASARLAKAAGSRPRKAPARPQSRRAATRRKRA